MQERCPVGGGGGARMHAQQPATSADAHLLAFALLSNLHHPALPFSYQPPIIRVTLSIEGWGGVGILPKQSAANHDGREEVERGRGA